MRLIDADAFDKVLEDAQIQCKRNGGNFRIGVLSTVRAGLKNASTVSLPDALRAAGWREEGWVSVKDRLPEETESMFARFYATEKWDRAMWKNESEAVLVCVRFPDGWKKVTIGRLRDGKWNTTVSKVLPHEVTHWMPLPEPPKEVKA